MSEPAQGSRESGVERPGRARHSVPQQDGVLILNKPKGPTSASCIARIKHGLSQKKIGHAGTLDPMAGGVLLVLLGQATKISGYLMGEDSHKVYSGVIRLGLVTDTWDAEGAILEENPVPALTDADAREAVREFLGTFEQEVPAYSAAKHQGKPLYKLARKGSPLPVKKKTVTVSRCEAELVGPERIWFRVTCSSGTYVRSLAHSLGTRLGCGAHLMELTREYSRPFALSQAHSLEEVLGEPEGFARKVHSIAEALPDWPKLSVTGDEAARVRSGGRLDYDPERMANLPCTPGFKVLMLDPAGTPLALAETAVSGGREVWALVRGLWNQEP